MKHRVISSCLTLAILAFSSLTSAEQKLTNQLALNGLLEIDAFSLSQDVSGDSADIIVSALEIGLEATINDNLSATVLFLYEDGFSGVEVDEAVLSLAINDKLSLNAGKMTLPFGRFDSAMLSDALTVELAETADTALQLVMNSDTLSASLTMFNGDNEKISTAPDDDQFRFLIALDFESDNLATGFSWISNIDSDSFADLTATTTNQDVPGFGFYLGWSINALSLTLEHMAALDDYVAGDFGGDVSIASRPTASTIEVAYELNDSATLALSFQQSSEAVFAGLKEEAVLASYSRSLQSGIDIGLEISNAKDYSIVNGGAGDDTSQVLFRLSAEF